MKVVRYALYAIVALIVLAVVAVGIAVAVINPNDYKPQIEAAVEKQTNLDLILEGDISWSFIPLGLELNTVEANLDGERLVALEQLIAQVNFWSLITLSPQVNTFLLDGLDARLKVNQQGEGNWTRIMPEETASGKETAAASAETADPAEQPGGGEILDFNVESVEISNASVHYNDLSTGQSVTLEDFNVSASNITLGSAFPLDIRFRIETEQPQLSVEGSISAQLWANRALNEFAMTGLTITMDDTTFSGSGSYNLKTGGIVVKLSGDRLNADRYLPPASENEAASAGSGGAAPEAAGSGQPETDLLPLDTLRSLRLDIDLGLGELIVSNLTIKELKASTTAENGVLKVDELSGKLYDGGFDATATIDARSNNPKWRIRSNVTNVQTLPLLTDLADVEMLSGGANLDAAIDTTGNRISTLRESAKGQISFNLAEGQLRNMNLTRMACQGIAMVNQDKLATTDWGTHTPFNDMRGTLNINGNTLNNKDLVAALAGMRLEGNGTVDLQKTEMDYELGLRIVGEIHRDKACRVTEYVENVVIPVECRGNFSEDPARLCSFDGSRFRDTVKDIAANAARARAQKEVDQAKKKAEDKVKEKVQDKLGEEASGKVKDTLKGLFN